MNININGPFFLGYGSLQNWANIVDARKPVYAMLHIESRQGNFTRVEREYVIFCQPHGNEMHYCRMPVSLTEWMHDQCMTPDGNVLRERSKQIWAALRQWLEDAGFQVRDAIPAFPKDYIFIEGVAEDLQHTAERGYFIESYSSVGKPL